jgi:two-component system, OmpR family, sensor histidine kinase SenX3
VKDVVESSAGLIESSGFTAEVAVSPDLPAVLADEDAVRRAITNLITNALKYGADGRWIGISARRVTVKGQQEVELAVSDRGRGIEPQDLAHIFEPFFRGRPALERQIHGNGLGLSLVKRIAESHGGRIAVKSVPGEGATFTLNLPAAPPEKPAALAETVEASS